MSDWRHRAACRDADPEVFFPLDDSDEKAAPAKAYCARCPVTVECLQWAVDTRQTAGIWGGQTETERRRARWRRQDAASRPVRYCRYVDCSTAVPFDSGSPYCSAACSQAAKCGTTTGLSGHRRRGETPCQPCRAAGSAAAAARWKRKRAQRRGASCTG